jgi:ribulose-5-phosphate 4-epimerase/fuculose-1-phosphate aldolase
MQQNPEPRRVLRREFVVRAAAALAGGLLAAPLRIGASQTSAAPLPSRDALVADLVAANRILARHGIVDGFGHVSVRDVRDPQRFLLSRSIAPELVSAADILEFDLESRTVDAKGPGYSERFIHGEIYKARADVQAIVHSHSPSVIPFGVTSVALRPVYHLAAFIGDGVPVFDIRKESGVTDMLVSDSPRGRALAQVLGARPVVLMRGHGVVVVGSSLPIAVGRSIYVESNAKVQAQALTLGGRITYLSPEEAHQIMAAGENGGYQRAWELWKQQAIVK